VDDILKISFNGLLDGINNLAYLLLLLHSSLWLTYRETLRGGLLIVLWMDNVSCDGQHIIPIEAHIYTGYIGLRIDCVVICNYEEAA
jgi:hypothetical protein